MDHESVTLTVADVDGSGTAEHKEAATERPRAGQRSRRTFTAAYKARMVAEYDACTEHGARGALLRREGLYQSHIGKWRAVLTSPTAGANAAPAVPANGGGDSKELRRLRAENAKIAAELTRTRAVMEVLGKAHALLEILSESAGGEPTPMR